MFGARSTMARNFHGIRDDLMHEEGPRSRSLASDDLKPRSCPRLLGSSDARRPTSPTVSRAKTRFHRVRFAKPLAVGRFDCDKRMLRGGIWDWTANMVRAGYRESGRVGARHSFRVVRTLNVQP
jgi:hypothetical protein